MAGNYGSLVVGFHGEAKNLRKLAPLVWTDPGDDLEKQLMVDPAAAPDDVLTLTAHISEGEFTVPCVYFLSAHVSGVEIVIYGDLITPATGFHHRYAAFLEATKEGEEKAPTEAELAGYMPYEGDWFSPDELFDPDSDGFKLNVLLTGATGNWYKFDMINCLNGNADVEFIKNAYSEAGYIAFEDDLDDGAYFKGVLLCADPASRHIDVLAEGVEDVSAVVPSEDLGNRSIRAVVKDGKTFYVDSEGRDYFILSEVLYGNMEVEGNLPDWIVDMDGLPNWVC